MSYLIIDGAQGEGGGQVLRTALTLSMLTGKAIELVNIRANRKKPGLMRQHLTSVLAAKTICNAKTDGVELGASRIRFSPGQVQPGKYHFAIGTAGSTVLVCQTILPVLALASAPSSVVFEGGTHNGMSPSLCFLTQCYLPLLEKMGAKCEVETQSLGFNPAGGGKWRIDIEPTVGLQAIRLQDPEFAQELKPEHCRLHAWVSKLPDEIGHREVATAKKHLGWQDAPSEVKNVDTPGPGNSFQLSVRGADHHNLFEVVGELGVSAERVAKRAAGRVKKFVNANVAVEEHLADQLLLLMAIGKGGSFTTTQPSLHTQTNIDVIKQVLGVQIKMEQLNGVRWRIYMENKDGYGNT